MTPSENQDKLERLVHQALRELPPRRAPATLAARVLAEIERRAALPWWRKSFVHWPLAARAVFILASAAGAKLALMVTVWVMAGFDPQQYRAAFAPQVAWVDHVLVVTDAMSGFCEIMLRNIPALWFYGGIAFIGAMYFALFGLGAAAYRALHPQPVSAANASL